MTSYGHAHVTSLSDQAWYSGFVRDDREMEDAQDAPRQMDAGRGRDTWTPRLKDNYLERWLGCWHHGVDQG